MSLAPALPERAEKLAGPNAGPTPGAASGTGPSAPPPLPEWRTYRRLSPFLRPYWRPLMLVLVISLVSTALGLAQPYLSKLMIDDALLQRDMGVLVQIAIIMVVVTLGGFAMNMLASYRYIRTSAAMLFDIRVELLRHLQTLSPRFYGGFRLGDLMSRINSDVSDVQRAAADTLLSVLSNVLMFFGCVAMLLWLDWRMFLISAVLLPACIIVFLHYQRKLTVITREMRERGADLGSLLLDTVMGMRVVVALRAGRHEVERFEARNDAFVQSMLRMQLTSFFAGALPGTILTASTSAVILYGGAKIIGGEMTIGTLVAFMAYHMRLFTPIQVLMGLSSNLASARVSLARIFELFDTPPEVAEKPSAPSREKLAGDICVEGVSLAHAGRPVLREASFTVPRGAFCAILGPSGAGKSTLADLLVRYLDPDAGRIRIAGHDLRDLRLADLRRDVLLVDQSTHLFNDTIGANLAFALPEADDRAIAAAVRHAGLEALVARLPHGLQTPVGERGLAISAGERQRIALARALLRRPSVLILDEPSSALDDETERLVGRGLREALPDATIIVITHKPALAAMADLVVTLDHGRATTQIRQGEAVA